MDTLNFAYFSNFDNFAFLLCTSRSFKTCFMLIRKIRAFVWAQVWLDWILRSEVTQLQTSNFGVIGAGQNCVPKVKIGYYLKKQWSYDFLTCFKVILGMELPLEQVYSKKLSDILVVSGKNRLVTRAARAARRTDLRHIKHRAWTKTFVELSMSTGHLLCGIGVLWYLHSEKFKIGWFMAL